MTESAWGFETRQIHAGSAPDPATGARAVPIYQTTSFQFQDTDHAAGLFDLAGRQRPPDHEPDAECARSAAQRLEGGVTTAIGLPGTLVVASGQSAETLAILNLAQAGDHIVASPSLYGGTQPVPPHVAEARHAVTFVADPDDLDAWRAAVQDNTKAFFGEVLPNPKNDVFDIEGVAGVAHDNGIPLIVDNTVATPYLIRPLEWGADIVVESLTKFIGGHGTSIAGAIVDGGTFDYGASGRFPNFTEPDPSYHGLAYWPALGPGAYVIKARVQLLRDLGAAISPFNAFLILQGIETLSLRMERHNANAQAIAEFLAARDDVLSVNYAGLPSSPWHSRALKLTDGRGFGAVLAFEIAGGLRPASASSTRSCTATSPTSATSQPGDPSGEYHPQPVDARGASGVGGDPGLCASAWSRRPDIIADLEVGRRRRRLTAGPGPAGPTAAAWPAGASETRALRQPRCGPWSWHLGRAQPASEPAHHGGAGRGSDADPGRNRDRARRASLAAGVLNQRSAARGVLRRPVIVGLAEERHLVGELVVRRQRCLGGGRTRSSVR